MLWRLASAWGDSPAKNSWTTCRLNSIECVRCLAMGFLLESPGQLADSQVPYLSTPRGALHRANRNGSCATRSASGMGGRLYIPNIGLGSRTVRIHQHSDARDRRR